VIATKRPIEDLIHLAARAEAESPDAGASQAVLGWTPVPTQTGDLRLRWYGRHTPYEVIGATFEDTADRDPVRTVRSTGALSAQHRPTSGRCRPSLGSNSRFDDSQQRVTSKRTLVTLTRRIAARECRPKSACPFGHGRPAEISAGLGRPKSRTLNECASFPRPSPWDQYEALK